MSGAAARAGALRGEGRTRLASLAQRYGALVLLAVVCALASARHESFATPENLLNVLRQNSMVGLVALGMTFVIASGGIDLSVGSQVALGGVVAASLTGHGSLAAITCAIALTAALGLVNGLVIAKGRLPPFIVTLAMMIGARGAALAATGERSVYASRAAEGFRWLGRGWAFEIPVPALVLLAAFAAGWVLLDRTRFGRHVLAVGDSEDTARLMGLRADRVTVAVYALSGALSGFAGVLLASRLGTGQPIAGMGWELDAITSVIVGGTRLTGGQGSVGTTLVGVLLLGVMFNVINLEGTISSWWQLSLRGLFLLAVVVLQRALVRRLKAD